MSWRRSRCVVRPVSSLLPPLVAPLLHFAPEAWKLETTLLACVKWSSHVCKNSKHSLGMSFPLMFCVHLFQHVQTWILMRHFWPRAELLKLPSMCCFHTVRACKIFAQLAPSQIPTQSHSTNRTDLLVRVLFQSPVVSCSSTQWCHCQQNKQNPTEKPERRKMLHQATSMHGHCQKRTMVQSTLSNCSPQMWCQVPQNSVTSPTDLKNIACECFQMCIKKSQNSFSLLISGKQWQHLLCWQAAFLHVKKSQSDDVWMSCKTPFDWSKSILNVCSSQFTRTEGLNHDAHWLSS